MKIAFHGGKCCGMKTIHGLGTSPDSSMGPKKKGRVTSSHGNNPDTFGADVMSKWNMYQASRPAETYGERLKAYVEYLDKVRPSGIIEITLADNDCQGNCWNHETYGNCYCHDSDQTPKWRPFLKKLGFKEVNNCLNSNSGNRVFVFHRNREV